MRGGISKMFDWLWHPSQDSGTVAQWMGGLMLILIASFLWATVINKIE